MRKTLKDFYYGNFILGFRLDVRMMIECMDEDDGNIQNMEDSES